MPTAPNPSSGIEGGSPIELSSILEAVIAIYVLLEWLGIVPDPLQLLIQAFEGRPRALSTIQVGSTLARARNPAARVWGIEILHMLQHRDIVLSDSDPAAQHLIGETREQFKFNLQNDGFTADQATQIADTIETRLENLGSLEFQALNHEPAAGTRIWGDSGWEKLYNQGLAHFDPQEHPNLTPDKYALRYALQRATVDQLLTLWISRVEPSPDWPPYFQQGGSGGGGPQPIKGAPEWVAQIKQNFDDKMDADVGKPLDAISGALGALPGALDQRVAQPLDSIREEIDKFLNALAGAGSPLAALAGALPQIIDLVKNLDLTQATKDLDTLAECVCPKLQALTDEVKNLRTQEWETPGYFAKLVNLGLVDRDVAGVTPQSAPADHPMAMKASDAAMGRKVSIARPTLAAMGPDEIARAGPKVEYTTHATWTDTIIDTVSSLIGALVSDVVKGLELVDSAIEPIIGGIAATVKPRIEATLQKDFSEWEFLPKAVLDLAVQEIEKRGGITEDNVEDVGLKLLGFAFVVGQLFHLAASVFGLLGYPISSLWGHNAVMGIQILAYEEILGAIHKSFFPAALQNRATQRYNRTFPTRVPPEGVAATWFGRRKIDAATLDKLQGAGGLDPAYRKAAAEFGYRPLSSFILARTFTNREYPTLAMKAIFEDLGYSPQNTAFINDAFEKLTTDALENSYLLQLEQAYAKGVVSIDELDQEAQNLEWSAKARAILRKRAVLVRSIDLISDVVKEYTPEVADGFATPEQMAAALDAAGAQPWFRDLQVGIAQAKAGLRATIKVQAIGRADAREILNLENKAALARYHEGAIDAIELALALTDAREEYLSNLQAYDLTPAELAPEANATPMLVAAQILAAQHTATRSEQFIYGLTLPKAEAEVLRAKVGAVLEQYKSTLITTQELLDRLQSFGIPEEPRRAIVAKAAAAAQHTHPGTTLEPL